MLNLKQNSYIAGVLALCALSACSSDNPSTAGSTTIPNAEAKRIEYHSDSVSVVSLNSVQINAFPAEKGIMVTCAEDQKAYDAKVRLNSDNTVEKSLVLSKFGNACDSIFSLFKSSCGSESEQPVGTCDEDGNLQTYCSYPDSKADYIELMNELWRQSNNPCNHFEYIDMLRTLDRYTEQFTDDPTELSFDSHVLAYNGTLSFEATIVSEEEGNNANRTFKDSRIWELSASEIPQYFPMTASIAGENIYKSNCKTYAIFEDDANQPTGHVLTRIAKDTVEVTGVYKSGFQVVTNAYFPIAFLVQDCEGLIDEKSTIVIKGHKAKTWCSALISKSDDELQEEFMDENGEWHWPSPEDWQSTYKPNPDCGEEGHESAVAYGEWYRADLAN